MLDSKQTKNQTEHKNTILSPIKMKLSKEQLKQLTNSHWFILIATIVVFYIFTFLIYYFYSPGPEERKQAQTQVTQSYPNLQKSGVQTSTLEVKNERTQQEKK